MILGGLAHAQQQQQQPQRDGQPRGTGGLEYLAAAAFPGPLQSTDVSAFAVSESHQGDSNFNGDGDTLDYVVFEHDPASGRTQNLGLASTDLTTGGALVAFR